MWLLTSLDSGGVCAFRSHLEQLNISSEMPPISGLNVPCQTGQHLRWHKLMGGFAMGGGVYQIENQVNGKRYIGSTVNLRRRWAEHLSNLRHGRHHNQHLQCALDKYGETAFSFSILEHVEEASQLILREQYYLDNCTSQYNILPIAGSVLGCHRSPEARRNMSKAAKRRGISPQTRTKMNETLKANGYSMYGKHHSDKSKRKIREALMGHRVSKETREKISDSLKGRQPSKEMRRKLSVAQKARRAREKEEEAN